MKLLQGCFTQNAPVSDVVANLTFWRTSLAILRTVPTVAYLATINPIMRWSKRILWRCHLNRYDSVSE